MSQALDTKFLQKMQQLFATLGVTAVIERITPGTYNPVTNERTNAALSMTVVSTPLLDESRKLLGRKGSYVYVKAPTATPPIGGDRLTLAGLTYVIASVNTHRVSNTVVAYELLLEGDG